MKSWKTLTLAFALLALCQSPALAQHEHILKNLKDAKWMDGPPMLPPGVKIAVLEGNPGAKGPVALLAKMPADYKIAAHSHPGDEHVVVLSGALYMGMGDKLDTAAGTALKAGGFAMMPAKKNHYAYTKAETIILVYGMGPIEFTYVNAADDPRNQKK